MKHQAHQEHQNHQEDLATLHAIARNVVDAGLKVHRALGPGLLESTYEHCLARERELRGIAHQRQVPIPIFYEGMQLDAGFRLDIVVQKSIVIEIQSVDALTRLHEAQLLTYLRFSHRRIGFLMNFNVVLFKQGLRRLAL